jgi:hypothetical protein
MVTTRRSSMVGTVICVECPVLTMTIAGLQILPAWKAQFLQPRGGTLGIPHLSCLVNDCLSCARHNYLGTDDRKPGSESQSRLHCHGFLTSLVLQGSSFHTVFLRQVWPKGNAGRWGHLNAGRRGVTSGSVNCQPIYRITNPW